METDEIVKLTRKGVSDLLSRRGRPGRRLGKERRRAPRWPFPGAVEVRPAAGDGTQQWFGTCRDVSEFGLAFSGDQYFETGTPVDIAFHLPEASFYGRATVRRCLKADNGFVVGVEFDFNEPSDPR